eukprot:163426-Rhodomonas_salina.1
MMFNGGGSMEGEPQCTGSPGTRPGYPCEKAWVRFPTSEGVGREGWGDWARVVRDSRIKPVLKWSAYPGGYPGTRVCIRASMPARIGWICPRKSR